MPILEGMNLDGWGQAKALQKTGTRFKSDERILRSSVFVEQTLSTDGPSLSTASKKRFCMRIADG